MRAGVGGYFGGTRGVVPRNTGPQPFGDNVGNQTEFGPGGEVYYPQPRSIRSLPPQLAGYTDDYSKAGQVASIEGQYNSQSQALYDFLNGDIDTILIDPAYKTAYNNVGNDPDSAEYVSNYRGGMPIHRMNKLQDLAKGLNQFADAASKYFDKKVEILPQPGFRNPRHHSRKNLRLTVQGYEDWDAEAAGFVYKDERIAEPKQGRVRTSNPNKTAYVPGLGPYTGTIYINTNMSDQQYRTDPEAVAHTFQHEFGHVLGTAHPEGHKTGGAKNSTMSYSMESHQQGAVLKPSDINFLKDLYKQADVNRRAKNAYKGVAKKRR